MPLLNRCSQCASRERPSLRIENRWRDAGATNCVTTYIARAPAPCCYNASMTLMEVTFELQSPLTPEQLRGLANFANTYGLRRFRVDEKNNRLSFEYDASRLRELQVADVLRQARIPVLRRVEPVATVSQT